MNKYHKQILLEIKRRGGKKEVRIDLNRYLGNSHKLYYTTTSQRREIARNWAKAHPDISKRQLLSLANSLYKGSSFEEKAIASAILKSYNAYYYELSLKNIEKWLKHLEGWAELDNLCYGFSLEEITHDWKAWKKLISDFSKHQNINHRRASLVLLTKAVKESGDKRVEKLAFRNIDRLKSENNILITKAVSWLLRSLIVNYRNSVESYLKANLDLLPKVAVREVRRKLETGRK